MLTSATCSLCGRRLNLFNNTIKCLLGARHCLCIIIIAVQEMDKKYLELISSWGDHEKYKMCYMVICIIEKNGAKEGSREFLDIVEAAILKRGKLGKIRLRR